MIETSIGTLKLFPVKEDGKFVFYNDAIKINGKIAKGDKISIYTDSYDIVDNKFKVKTAGALNAKLLIRNETFELDNIQDHLSIDDFYNFVTEFYKNKYYFNK